MRRLVPAIAVLTVLGGCGNDRTEPPDVRAPSAPVGDEIVEYPRQGIGFKAPTGWNLDNGTAPLISTMQTGQATLAIWRYARSEPLPRTPAELEAARVALLAAAKQRDPSFEAIKSAATEIARRPAVQIRARETIAGQRRLVRSTHVYHAGAEIVIDAFAAPASFRRVDAEVFRPLLRSLTVRKPAPGA